MTLGSLLDVQGLMAGYGSGDILQGINLKIEGGEIVATIGRNGVGKSTLMKTSSDCSPPAPDRFGSREEQLRICRRTNARRWAWVTCPKGGISFPNSQSRKTC